MTVLVLGATGATGQRVVKELLGRQLKVKIVIRSAGSLPENIIKHELADITYASISELSEEELFMQVKDCHSVISCLGHNLTCKGIFGHPRRLVTDTVKRVNYAIAATKPKTPVKFILMSTTGFQNHATCEQVSLLHRAVIAILRLTLPPHVDNEQAAEFLQNNLTGEPSHIEWAAVRPDTLTDQPNVTAYDIEPSPLSDPIFDSKKTSRANVAHFMAELVTSTELWREWQGQLPVIYNRLQNES